MTGNPSGFPARIGGNLCLDYINTIEFRHREREQEFLDSYPRLLAWCRRSDLISEAERADLEAETHPAQADAVYRAALDLREALYAMFTAVIAGKPPSSSDLARLNQTLAAAQRQVEPGDHGLQWAWANHDAAARVLAPIALAAGELLTSDQLKWVRQCPNCGWLFLDTSRNHSRRWCSMDFCGSEVKSRRQYQRRKNQPKAD